MKRKWDVSSKEVRKRTVEEVLGRLDEQSGAAFGQVAADEIIDIVLENIGPDLYNLAIRDAKKLVQGRFADIDAELDLLEHSS